MPALAAKGVHSYRRGSPPAAPATARSGWRCWCAVRRRSATCAPTSTACQASKQQLKAAATTGPARTCCWCHIGSNTAADSGKTLGWATLRAKQLVNDLSARDSTTLHTQRHRRCSSSCCSRVTSTAPTCTPLQGATHTHAGRMTRVSTPTSATPGRCSLSHMRSGAHSGRLSVHLCC